VNRTLSADELETALRRIGETRYHNLHPFHRRLHGGQCSRAEVQAWALNRYFYQAMVPIKDATVLTRMEDPALRREWRQRIVDQDGHEGGDGGMLRHYDFVTRETLAYFTARPPQAQRDSDFALRYVREHARSPADQDKAMRALEFKCDLLWAQLDALWHAYVEGHVPPGAWTPEAAG
jgi:pyrroloquinoline quinone (PQQ) biosynthesis protein C